MTIQELHDLVRELKTAIVQANNKAQYGRVRYMKWARARIKRKIINAKMSKRLI